MRRPGLVVALPARNCASDLPAWFASVARYADAVVALDDGSTDDTARHLAEHPLTAVLLRNPTRNSFAGWDDALNRQRLVDACAELEPRWVLQVDADERLPDEDAEALRRAVDHGVLDPGAAYLLRVFQVVSRDPPGPEGERIPPTDAWYGRLFAWRPGIRLPGRRLHLVPLPVDIPRERWVRATLRILHYAGSTPERRRARFAKYEQADPDRVWQETYDHLLREPAEVEALPPRPPNLPVVRHQRWPGERREAARHPPGEPLLTAVVIARDDEARIARAVEAVVAQEVSATVQIVVVVSGSDRTADIVRERFPDVELVELDRPALPGEARNAGLARARGRYVSFPGSHVVLAPGSLEARLQAHLDGWAMVSGVKVNGTPTAAGWASYFLDHSTALPGQPSQPLDFAPPAASYLTAALRHLGGFPEGIRSGEDTRVNTELFDLGYGAWRERRVVLVHHSPCRSLGILLRHHHRRGRGLGWLLRRRQPPGRRLVGRRLVLSLGLGYLPARLVRIHRSVWRFGGPLRWRWLAVLPLAAAGAAAAWLGTWRELLGRREPPP